MRSCGCFRRKKSGHGAGIVTGSAGYNLIDRTASIDLVGASLPLANFQKLQSPRFALDGQVSFRLKANGPPMAPQGEGTFRVVDLAGRAVGNGEFRRDAELGWTHGATGAGVGDERRRNIGAYTLVLADPYNIEGKVTVRNMASRRANFGRAAPANIQWHGRADGEIGLSGSLKRPESILLDAKFSRLTFNYANVQLENVGPVHFRSSRDNLQIEPAEFRGTDTTFVLAEISVSRSVRR